MADEVSATLETEFSGEELDGEKLDVDDIETKTSELLQSAIRISFSEAQGHLQELINSLRVQVLADLGEMHEDELEELKYRANSSKMSGLHRLVLEYLRNQGSEFPHPVYKRTLEILKKECFYRTLIKIKRKLAERPQQSTTKAKAQTEEPSDEGEPEPS